MKKLLLLLLPILGFSQDLQYAAKLNELDKSDLQTVANDITSGFDPPVKMYEQYVNYSNDLVFTYYRIDLPQDVIAKDSKLTYCKLCTEVVFDQYMKGSNSDLQIKGEEKFSFKYVSGKYLDLYPWWEKHFAPGISKEDLIDKNHNNRYIKNYKPDIDLRFTKQMDNWDIRNAY